MLARVTGLLALVLSLVLAVPGLATNSVLSCPLFHSPLLVPPGGRDLAGWIDALVLTTVPEPFAVVEPAEGALVPADAASPLFRWRDPAVVRWLVTLSVAGVPVCRGIVDSPEWAPDQTLWEAVKSAAGGRVIRAEIRGIDADSALVSLGETSLAVSGDPVGAPIAFLRKRLPFRTAKENPNDSQMLVGDVGSYGRPRVVVQDQPVCFNCHAFSLDGRTYGMDMDYKGDKGGYALVDVRDSVSLTDRDFISWNAYKAPGPARYSMGLFTSFSPDGRYAASTVGEASAFVMLDDLFFSQMFYPATGQIAVYDRRRGGVRPLPGADDTGLVQTNPSFTADGGRVVFARAEVRPELLAAIAAGELRREDPAQHIRAVNARYPVQFSLWSVPFNNGRGGRAEPVAGASDNGLSNFFPKFSPDGRWLAFTQCRTGLVLQPDSRLAIVPAGGGVCRVLAANTGLMNSWHTWSPNSRWLAFASKGHSPYTEIFLTHIDAAGRSSPALRLFRFSHPAMAAMVPEFVPDKTRYPRTMELADPNGALGESMATDGR